MITTSKRPTIGEASDDPSDYASIQRLLSATIDAANARDTEPEA